VSQSQVGYYRRGMSSQISWMLELNLNPGREQEFTALMKEMVASARDNEPGTLSYEWSLSADGTACHIFERYTDSAAVLVHGATFESKFAARFLEILRPTRCVVYGSPSQDVRTALAGFNPVYMQSVGGFDR
jgi:quinol monooxygenase YgiN